MKSENLLKRLLCSLLVLAMVFSTAAISFADDNESSPAVQEEAVERAAAELEKLADISGGIKDLSYVFYGVGGRDCYDMTANAEEIALLLSEVVPVSVTMEEACDFDEFFVFTLDDGSELTYHFNMENFCLNDSSSVTGTVNFKVENYPKISPKKYASFYSDNEGLDLAYASVTGRLIKSMKEKIGNQDYFMTLCNWSRGCTGDFLNSGLDMLLLVCSPDGENLEAAIYAVGGNGSLQKVIIPLGVLAGAGTGKIYVDDSGEELKVSAVYNNYDGDMKIEEVHTYSVGYDIWQAKENEISGSLVVEFGENGVGTPLAALYAG